MIYFNPRGPHASFPLGMHLNSIIIMSSECTVFSRFIQFDRLRVLLVYTLMPSGCGWLAGWLGMYVASCPRLFSHFRFVYILQTQQTSGYHRVGARLSFWRPSDDSFHRFRRVSQQVKTALKRPKTCRNSTTAGRTAAKRSTKPE